MKKKYVLFVAVFAMLAVSTTVFADVTSNSDAAAGALAVAGSGNSGSSLTLTQGGSTVPRGFVIPNTNNWVPTPNDFGNGQMYWNFVPSVGMIQYTQTYKASDLQSIVKVKNVKFNPRFWGNEPLSSEVTFGVGPGYFETLDKVRIDRYGDNQSRERQGRLF
jgi:hypothetical protein